MLVSSAKVPLATYKTRQPYKTINLICLHTLPDSLQVKESECEGCRGEDLLI